MKLKMKMERKSLVSTTVIISSGSMGKVIIWIENFLDFPYAAVRKMSKTAEEITYHFF